MADRITVSCSGCHKKLAVPSTAAGKRIKCPGCAAAVLVPGENPAAVASTIANKPPQEIQKQTPRKAKPARESIPHRGALASASKRPEAAAKPRKKRKRAVPVEEDWLTDDGFEEASYGGTMPPKQKKKRKASGKLRLKNSGNEPPPVNRGAGMSFKERLIYGGGLKGVVMMIGGTIWLVVGLMGGRFFFYAPILIIAGLFTSVKSLFGDD